MISITSTVPSPTLNDVSKTKTGVVETMNSQTIYLEMYKEWRNHLRHHEIQRSTITAVSFAIAGVTGGYVATFYAQYHAVLLMPGIFLTVLGIAAYLITQKQYERMQRAITVADVFQAAIDGMESGQLESAIVTLESPPPGKVFKRATPEVIERNRLFERASLTAEQQIQISANPPSISRIMRAAELIQHANYPLLYGLKLHVRGISYF